MATEADTLYESQIRRLSEADRLRLVELITRDLAEGAQRRQGGRSVLGLRGLGAEIWKGLNAGDYVDALRDEWDRTP